MYDFTSLIIKVSLTLLCNLCSLKSLLNVIFNRNNKIHHLKCTKHMLQNYAQKKLLNIVNFTSKTGLKICKTKAKQGDSEIFIDNNAHCLFMHINISKFKKIVCIISLWTFYHWILPNRHVSNIQQISGFFVVNQWLINVFKILIDQPGAIEAMIYKWYVWPLIFQITRLEKKRNEWNPVYIFK